MPNFFDDILLEPGKKIGIGTDTPTEALEIVGSAKINGSIQLSAGEHISTFSSDGSLIGDSNQTVPTEQAVKRYVDDQVDGLNTALSGKADQTALTAVGDRVTPLETTLPTKADQTSVTTLTGQIDDILNIRLPLKADQTALTAVGDRVTPLETTLATKADQTDVDTRLNAKANLSGSLGQDFNANDLTVQGTLTVQGDMIARDVEHVAGSLAFGNEDTDTITIHGVLRSNHSSGALEVSSPLHVTGGLTVDSGLTVSSINASGTVQTGALTVTGDLSVSGINATGTIRATRLEGDGSALTGISSGQWTDGTSGRIFYTGGNVGIGTTAPTKRLEVAGDIQANGIIRAANGFRPSTNDWEIARNGEDLEIREPEQQNKVWARFKDDRSLHLIGTPDLWVDGQVGIGTTSPSEKLDVRGNVKASQFQGKGALLAFVSYDGRARVIRNGFNVASVSRVGVGRYDIRWSVRTNAHGPFACWTWGIGGGVRVTGRGSGSTLLQVNVRSSQNQLVDDSVMIMVAG